MSAPLDLVGQRFGTLRVLERVHYPHEKQPRWFCICDCGGCTATWTGHLLQGRTKSCGCNHHPKNPPQPKKKRGRKPRDRTGEQYGMLTVIGQQAPDKWLCLCECGQTTTRNTRYLNRSTMPSCGCANRPVQGKAARNGLYTKYRLGAERRNILFNLPKEQFSAITTQLCHYCGALPAQVAGKSSKGDRCLYNGIDRVDNSRGYVAGNCVPCCGVCNRMKHTMEKSEFLAHVARINGNFVHKRP